MFINCQTICLSSLSPSGEPRTIIDHEWLGLSGVLPSHVTITWFPIHLLTCGRFQLFIECYTTFLVFSCPLPNFFGTCCRHQIQNVYIFPKRRKQYSWSAWALNISSLCCGQLNIGWKSLHSYFTQCCNLFGTGVCNWTHTHCTCIYFPI